TVPRTISIRNPEATLHPDKDTAKQVRNDAPKRTAEYTPRQLKAAWESFMASRPTQHILVNTMRASRPEPHESTPHLYTVTVENKGQKELLETEMPDLLETIHNSLENDLVAFEVLINQGPSSPSTWSEREIIQYLAQEYPKVARMMKEFKLSLT
ncbi:MAG: hypothetical protein K2I52_02395, partial [Muribaculaceae bacterium]|nr:hypothetical protein [Muribaculaceae bacterium]